MQFAAGLVAGVGIGNMLIYRFLWERSWGDAAGIGLTAGALALFFYWLLSIWR